MEQNLLYQMGMNQILMNQIRTNQIGNNPIGINNQPNEINQIGMDNTTLNIKNIVQPYENKIKELQEIIRQKDFEITVLKQKLNNNSSKNNFMNENPIIMNQKLNPMLMLDNKGRKLLITIKTKNIEFHNECFEGDRVSKLYEKNNITSGWLIYNYKVLDINSTLKENGFEDFSIIFLKNDSMNIIFRDNRGKNISLSLSKDCPLELAFIYYLIKSNYILYLFSILSGKNELAFLYNAKKMNFTDIRPIEIIFKGSANPVITVSFSNF